MKNTAVIFSLLFLSVQTLASTRALFSSSNPKAKVDIIVQGLIGDKDASNLYSLLNSQAVDTGSHLQKEVAFKDREGVDAVNISCRISKQVENFGSCTITISKAHYSNIMPSANYAAYGVFDVEEAARISKLFIIPSNVKDLYKSEDRHLTIFYENSDIGDFGIVYAGYN